MPPTDSRQLTTLVSLVLLVMTLAVFWPVAQHEFINFDDNLYVTENRHVQQGVTLEGLRWAFTTVQASNWHPLTWLSHMLDVELYGLKPAGHHLTNLLLHAANTLLLFMVLRRMTGALWRSACVAALFAVHPLHVESVAWVAERKDVLSTLFWLLTMWAYVRYVEQPSLHRYLLVVLALALGLLAKPMLVTLPFVLLLLDVWPLKRVRWEDVTRAAGWRVMGRLAWEKAPLLVLVIASSVITYLAQQQGGSVESLKILPAGFRIENALVSYLHYLGKLVWPQGLAVLYPYPGVLPLWQVAGAAVVLVGATVVFLFAGKHRPYLAVGWLWYLGTLVPVIGLVQVGSQAMADRYTYVPFIGLFLMIAWGVADLTAGWRHRTVVLAAAAVGVVSVCIVLTRADLRYWRSSATLFEHALQVTEKNYTAYNNLGLVLAGEGKSQEAIHYYRKALLIWPNYPLARYNIGLALAHEGQDEEAIWHYSQVLQANPNDDMTHNNLGTVLVHQGKVDEAISHFTEALRLNPDLALAHNNLGLALAKQGRYGAALGQFTEAVRLEPEGPAHNNLGMVLGHQGKFDEAISHFTEALRINPGQAVVHNNLGLALAKQGRYEAALGQFTEAVRLEPKKPDGYYNLGAVYFQLGRVDEAVQEFETVLTLDPQYPNARKNLDRALQKRGSSGTLAP